MEYRDDVQADVSIALDLPLRPRRRDELVNPISGMLALPTDDALSRADRRNGEAVPPFTLLAKPMLTSLRIGFRHVSKRLPLPQRYQTVPC